MIAKCCAGPDHCFFATKAVQEFAHDYLCCHFNFNKFGYKMTLVNGGPDLNFIEHIPCYKMISGWWPFTCIYLSSFSHVSLYHCSGTTSYNFRLQQHESEELGLLPARKYEYLVLASSILLVAPPIEGCKCSTTKSNLCSFFEFKHHIESHVPFSLDLLKICSLLKSVPIPSGHLWH